jgi:4-amino-4-deoxy-L-arabinose transferase-like glycosyltransferase
MRIIKLLKAHWILIVLLGVGSYIRLYKIADYLVFLGDEGRDVLVMKHIIEGFQAFLQGNFSRAADLLTLLGPTSSVGGFFLGPFYYYFTAPSLLLAGFDPVGPAIMVALVGVATVWLVYHVGKEFFGTRAALIAAGLYAISPLVITYSRSSWNPNVMPFFTLLLMYVLYKSVILKSWKGFVLSGLLYGIVMQLHYIAVFLAPIIALFIAVSFWISSKGQPLNLRIFNIGKNYLLLAVGFFIAISPWLLFELRHNLLNIRNIATFIFASEEVAGGGNFFLIVSTVFFRLFSRLIFSFPSYEIWDEFNASSLVGFGIPIVGITLFALYLFIRDMYRAYQKDMAKFLQFFLVIVWVFLGILIFGFYQKDIYDYYLAFLFPVPFLIFGYALSVLSEKSKRYAFVVLIFLTIVAAVHVSKMPFQKEANRQLAQARTISEFVLEKADGKPFNFAIITGGNSDHAYRYFFDIHNQPAIVIENDEKDPERKSVTDQLFVVCESLPCGPLGHSVWEIAGFGRAEIAEEWDVSVVKVYKLVKYEGEE